MFQKIGICYFLMLFLALHSYASIKKPNLKPYSPEKQDVKASRYFAQLISKISSDNYKDTDVKNVIKNDKNKIFKIYKDEFSFLLNIKKEKNFKKIHQNCENYLQPRESREFHNYLKNLISNLCHEKLASLLIKEENIINEALAIQYLEKNILYFSQNKEKELIQIHELMKKANSIYFSKYSNKIYSTYISNNFRPSFKILSTLPVSNEFTAFIQERGINQKQNMSIYTRELYKIYKEIKENINSPKKVTQLVDEYISFLLLNTKHIEFDRAIRQAEILTRYLAPRGYKFQNTKILNTFENLSTKNSEYEHRIIFHKLWSFLINDNFRDAYAFIKENNYIEKYHELDQRLKFWIPYTLRENGLNSEAVKLYNSFISSENIGYYTILARKELNLLESDQIKPKFQLRNTSSTLKLTKNDSVPMKRIMSWLEIGYEKFAKKELNQFLSKIQPSQKSDYLFKISEILNQNENYLFTFKTLYNALDENIISYNSKTVKNLFPMAFFNEIKKESNELDPIVVISLIRQESAFNPEAKSHVGARGLMQLMPKTAMQFKKNLEVKQLKKPNLNIQIGVQYLSRLIEMYEGNLIHTLAAYNAGEGRVKQWKKNYFKSKDPLINVEAIPFEETQKYVKLIYRNIYFYKYILDKDIKINSLKETFFTALNTAQNSTIQN